MDGAPWMFALNCVVGVASSAAGSGCTRSGKLKTAKTMTTIGPSHEGAGNFVGDRAPELQQLTCVAAPLGAKCMTHFVMAGPEKKVRRSQAISVSRLECCH